MSPLRRAGHVLVAVLLALAVLAGCTVSTNDEPVAVGGVFDNVVQTTSTTTTTSLPQADTKPALLYFLREEAGSTELVEIRREVDVGADVEEILSVLFKATPGAGDGATDDEEGLTTAFPDTATLLSADVVADTTRLVVDTRGLFGAVQSERLRNALAQIVWTATSDPAISEVLFLDAGERRSAIAGSGEEVVEPVDRGDYRTLD